MKKNLHHSLSLLTKLSPDFPDDSAGDEDIEDLYLQEILENLHSLFASRCDFSGQFDDYDELTHSCINYGIPDLTSLNILNQRDLKVFCDKVTQAIIAFEPRLINPTFSVMLKSNDGHSTPVSQINFMLSSQIKFGGIAHDVNLVSNLDNVTRTLSVKEEEF